MPSAVAVDFPEATLSGLPILTPYGVAGFIPASKVVFDLMIEPRHRIGETSRKFAEWATA